MITIVLVSGASGAGKTSVLHTFEELGYSIVENVPYSVFPALIEAFKNDDVRYQKVVVTCELYSAKKIAEYLKKDNQLKIVTVCLTADPKELLKRFKLTRHVHPLQPHNYSLEKAINLDQVFVSELRDKSDFFIDTTSYSVTDLRRIIFKSFDDSNHYLTVSFVSFGYKFGVPIGADMICDTRIIPNPFYVDELKNLTGLDEPVKKFIFAQKETEQFLNNLIHYLDYYLKKYEAEGKSYYSIGIGCSGGQHRSVAIAEYLAEHYKNEFKTSAIHHDIGNKNT